jgi:IS5 family transposase
LREEVELHLAYRWFCRLDLDAQIPDHSTFSVNRHGRFRDGEVLRGLFEAVVRACMDAGLIKGEGAACSRLPSRHPLYCTADEILADIPHKLSQRYLTLDEIHCIALLAPHRLYIRDIRQALTDRPHQRPGQVLGQPSLDALHVLPPFATPCWYRLNEHIMVLSR